MSNVAPTWLSRVYVGALALHGGVVLLVIWLGASVVFGGGADSAPDNLLFSGLLLIPILLGILPSGIALLSWHLCRRQGVAPSPGHMGLSVALAAAWLILLSVSILS